MYAFITGIIEEKNENAVVINNNGVGYEIFASSNTIANVGQVGDMAKVYTYLHVREDAYLLYGFLNLEEKQTFLNLITVSGIGAKMAIGIMSSISIKDLNYAIAVGDVATLSNLKGVGKKTAERLVLELKGTLKENVFVNTQSVAGTTVTVSEVSEAIEALASMGITRLQAMQLVKAVAKDGDSAEEIVAKALRSM